MKVAFFGSYLFLVPLLLEKFESVDIYLEAPSDQMHSALDYYDTHIVALGKTSLHALPKDLPISSALPFYDIGFSASFGRIFKATDIRKFKYLFNLHPGPVSLARGRHPLPFAIKYNHDYIGVTFHQINSESIDAGPILLEWKLARPDLPYQDLDMIVSSMAKASFKIALDLICATFPNIYFAPCNPIAAAYYPPLSASDLSAIMKPQCQ